MNTKPEIKDLLDISNFYGSNKEFVIAGGGNTSFKNKDTIWIKASGFPLATLSEEGLVALDREKLREVSLKSYPEDPLQREEAVKKDLYASILDTSTGRRPSVETSLHDLIAYRFVVHLHPTVINSLLCSRNAKKITDKLFGDEVVFVPYTDPGYILFKKLEKEIRSYRETKGQDPKVILLENHGSFVAADSTEEIRSIYSDLVFKISGEIRLNETPLPLDYSRIMHTVLPALRMMTGNGKPLVVRMRNNTLLNEFCRNQQEFHKISMPLTPDIIVYCKSRYIYIENTATPGSILESFRYQLKNFRNEFKFEPRVIAMKDIGIIALAGSWAEAETVLDVFEDMVKIVEGASKLGGVKYLTPEQVAFIDDWEVENYRRKIAGGESGKAAIANKTAIITGGAQGFGAGIASSLAAAGMNVVIADLNEAAGTKLAEDLNSEKRQSRSIFISANVADAPSVENLVRATVREFGGFDLVISNAGILRAGSLDEMEPDVFSATTDVNYNGYFHCAKYASEVLKIQNSENPAYFSDIIQINSKSGLRGSNRNFAYAGSKFGGIGLTQSFALELAPFRIKVNSICPGNFYEGPLWSDPVNGLFVQYLRTGKVPGAKNIDDVRKFYESQVPLQRGCRLEDVVKAILYVVDQEYETGQAIPVTGGQVMLG